MQIYYFSLKYKKKRRKKNRQKNDGFCNKIINNIQLF